MSWNYNEDSIQHNVYLIEIDGKNGPFLKIGYTWSMPLRMRKLRSQHCSKIRVIAVIPKKGVYPTRKLENQLLDQFREFAITKRGEYFHYTPIILTKFIRTKRVRPALVHGEESIYGQNKH